MCAGAGTSVSSRFSANSSNHSGRFRKRSSEARWMSFFFIFVLSLWWIAPVSWCGFVTSLWSWTWRCTRRVLRWRCRGRTSTRIWRQSRDNERYEVFRFAQNVLPLLGQLWFLTAGPQVYPCSSQSSCSCKANTVWSWTESCNFGLYKPTISVGMPLAADRGWSHLKTKSWTSSFCKRILNRSGRPCTAS